MNYILTFHSHQSRSRSVVGLTQSRNWWKLEKNSLTTFWGETPSMKECEKFLQKYPHPEKGRTAQDIQDKAKRMIGAEGKPRKKK